MFYTNYAEETFRQHLMLLEPTANRENDAIYLKAIIAPVQTIIGKDQ